MCIGLTLNRLRKVKMDQAGFFLLSSMDFLNKGAVEEQPSVAVYSIKLTVLLLSFLIANSCCGKQCSQGQIRAEGSSFLLQTHTHRLQVSSFSIFNSYTFLVATINFAFSVDNSYYAKLYQNEVSPILSWAGIGLCIGVRVVESWAWN